MESDVHQGKNAWARCGSQEVGPPALPDADAVANDGRDETENQRMDRN